MPRIIIAEEDNNYVRPLAREFVRTLYRKADVEIVTSKAYFDSLFSKPQQADLLAVSEGFFSVGLLRHDISCICVLTDQPDRCGRNSHDGIRYVRKYSSVAEVFNALIGAASLENPGEERTARTSVVLITSAAGGTGKTTVATELCRVLSEYRRKVLYMDAEPIQVFQHFFEDRRPAEHVLELVSSLNDTEAFYSELIRMVRSEHFDYLPAFGALPDTLGLPDNIYERITQAVCVSGIYDYIVIDTDNHFDSSKLALLAMADRVIFVTDDTERVGNAMDILRGSIDMTGDRFITVSNRRNDEDKKRIRGLAMML